MGSLHRGGAETMIMNYYRAFNKDICQMDFIVHARNDGDYSFEAENTGARVTELPTVGKIGMVKYIKLLTDTIKKNGPYDAVHAHYDYQDFLAVIAARIAGVKTVVVHSHTTSFKKHRLFVNRLVFKLFGAVCVACGEKAGNAFFGKNKYVVISNSMDAQKFMSASENADGEHKNKTVIGHLGRFVTTKNHEFIIELAKELKRQNVNVEFRLFGEGELREKIENLVKSYGLEDCVNFMGLTNDTVSAYKSFDIFILPSLFEGVPLTAVEAQLCGLKCLMSDAVTKECDIEQDLASFLPLDINVWVEKIKKLTEDDLTHKQTVRNDKVNSYDVNIQWKKLLSIYEGNLK